MAVCSLKVTFNTSHNMVKFKKLSFSYKVTTFLLLLLLLIVLFHVVVVSRLQD